MSCELALKQNTDLNTQILLQNEHIPFSGVPFFVLGEKLLECHHGRDRNIWAKRKYHQKEVTCIVVFKDLNPVK